MLNTHNSIARKLLTTHVFPPFLALDTIQMSPSEKERIHTPVKNYLQDKELGVIKLKS